MFPSFLLLSVLTGCGRALPDPSGDPVYPDQTALEAAFCRDVEEGLALLAAIASEPQMRDYLLYQTAQQRPGGRRVICPHIESEAIRGRCLGRLDGRPHLAGLKPEGYADVYPDCPGLSGQVGPEAAE